MVPGQKRQALPGRVEAWKRIEVRTPTKRRDLAGGERDAGEGVLGLAARALSLGDAEDALARGIELQIRVARGPRRGQRGRHAVAAADPVKALVPVVDEDHQSGAGGEGTAAVLVHARAHREGRGDERAGRAAGGLGPQALAALLGRPALAPVGVIAVEPHATEPHAARGHHVGTERRGPRAVRSGPAWSALASWSAALAGHCGEQR